ncbi:hypothetical protein BEH94_04800 [Candidatus Altiarchaeales archaeon WOR_SM1_SCG]|nr:hypothetical protein BEH94_04800 [Candidatus Altiarchaeales archaeon WOR_SM1_SCG]
MIKIPEELLDKSIAKALDELGIKYYKEGNLKKAVEYYNLALESAEQVNDRSLQAQILNRLGIAYGTSQNFDKTIEYLKKSKKIFEEIGDKKILSEVLDNLGITYSRMNEWDNAVRFYEEGMKIKKEISDREGYLKSLINLGMMYYNHEDMDKSLEYYNEGLKFSQKIGDNHGMVQCLQNMSNIYYIKGDIGRSSKYNKEALKINKELGKKNIASQDNGDIGVVKMDYLKELMNRHKMCFISGYLSLISVMGLISLSIFFTFAFLGIYSYQISKFIPFVASFIMISITAVYYRAVNALESEELLYLVISTFLIRCKKRPLPVNITNLINRHAENLVAACYAHQPVDTQGDLKTFGTLVYYAFHLDALNNLEREGNLPKMLENLSEFITKNFEVITIPRAYDARSRGQLLDDFKMFIKSNLLPMPPIDRNANILPPPSFFRWTTKFWIASFRTSPPMPEKIIS